MPFKKLHMGLLIGLISYSSISLAIPVHYDESVSGDLVHGSQYDQTTNIGTLGAGLNTVSGSINRPLVGVKDSADEFNFNIATGFELTSVIFYYWDMTGLVRMNNFLRHIDDPTLPTIFFNQNELIEFTTDQSPINSFQSVLPVNEGLFQITTGGNYGFTGDMAFSYEWRLDVKPVPEPSIIWLLGSGLALIGVTKRKHKQFIT